MARRQLLRFEYPILVALAAVGMMMMVSAGDLMSLYMGLELQSLALYVVASLRRESAKSTEAGLKYFVLGALTSGLLLYGASLTYGYAGTTLFAGIIGAARRGQHVARPALRSRLHHRRASPSRSRRCRSTCGRPTSTRARRRRSPPSSPPRPRWRRWPSSRGCCTMPSAASSATGSRSSR